MNYRIKLVLILTAFLLAGNTLAAERGQHSERMHARGGPDIGMQVIQHLTKAIRRLDLSEEQKTAVRAEFSGMKEDLRPLIRQLHEGRKELRGVIISEQYDADAVAAIAEQQGTLTAEITVLVSEIASSVLARLTDEQRADLQAMGVERREHQEGHREMMRSRRESRNQDGSEGS